MKSWGGTIRKSSKTVLLSTVVAGIFLGLFASNGLALAPPKSFKKCVACHQVGEDAKNTVGPQLNALEERPIGSVPGYKYSKALKKFAQENDIWTVNTLGEFLKKPRKYIRGTKMSFAGLKKESERTELVNWLLHTAEKKADTSADQLLGASAAAQQADPEYGQYLSGECVTCHRPGGAEGIPNINGWESRNFIHVLYEYKQEVRKNPVMVTVAKRLGDEEIAALAAYFASIEAE